MRVSRPNEPQFHPVEKRRRAIVLNDTVADNTRSEY